ncbi:M50 family metallopeptidase [Mycetocola reblochoni]|uniref:Membrane-associated zinc metalloprotease n=2 Tax=Mycetocola reblochoni TaxID=331618 RepID=A0A1R4JU37_9MICO|nr:site-2 protease family protein [Mycetocola reblochoni]RLP70370.1 PDZ domain-containing protein [Mycetocola reblochoni]SJN35518.1 Membrane-associated zinc metalloprotease [Mycetocola reblochoni REB411]
METVLLYLVGVVVIALGLGLSIGLHEIGHLVPAKLFGIKVTQYMVGFGRTVFSRRRGETEYGIKLIPLGGYISMIGMFPPRAPGSAAEESSTGFFQALDESRRRREPEDAGRDDADTDEAAGVRGAEDGSAAADGAQRTGRLESIIRDAREVSAESIGEGEDDRAFYRQAVWKRVVVMLGGPLMNLLLAVVFYAILLMGFGTPVTTTTVASVNECVITSGEQRQQCTDTDPTAPAAEAGIRAGDRIVSVDGTAVATWEQSSAIIRESPERSIPVVVERDGEQLALTLRPMLTERPQLDADGQPLTDDDGDPVVAEQGFAGMVAQQRLEPQGPGSVLPAVGENIAAVGNIILNLPQRLIDTAEAAFGQGERDADGPISVVGVGRLAGEVVSMDEVPLASKAATLVGMLGSLNVALFVFNLVPLMPLDGGHVVTALWEKIKRTTARLLGRPDPGPVDGAKAVPVTIVVAALLGAMVLLLVYADIVKPISLL